MNQSANEEIESGQRFTFGKNWSSFLKNVDESRISIAIKSLQNLLGVHNLAGKRFLDIGSGSGLFSLAAVRLGAEVVSIDFDPASVACANELKARFEEDAPQWTIVEGSALDDGFMNSFGDFDVVYSWGVLHHTGDMWRAMDIASRNVKVYGTLAIALYNDQGWRSRIWRRVKEIYCSGPVGRAVMKAIYYPWFTLRTILVSLVRTENEFKAYRRNRGMSIVHDWNDWLGGLPYEVVKFDDVVHFYASRNFELVNSKQTQRLGCHEFVFRRSPFETKPPRILSADRAAIAQKMARRKADK
ncbi:class I SAM-dependent methyltransferase [Planctomicrobium sp. SH527]|uniref:class I SAM-dependent methyltransferase n=1 Tax=Planctomicrobium sp. SH527 TaxID=3448123 RepID=UPI003F5C7CCA